MKNMMNRICVIAIVVVFASIIGVAQKPDPSASRPGLFDDAPATTNQTLINLARSAKAAWLTGDYDSVIRLSDEGIKLAPKEPWLWGNKTSALLERATATYNRWPFSSDADLRKALIEAARADLRAALATSAKTLELTKALSVPSDQLELVSYQVYQLMALRTRARALFLFTIVVDESYATPAIGAFEDWIAVETDPKIKVDAQLREGDMLLRANRFPEAFIAYQKILLDDSANVDAKLGAGVSLIDLGFLTNDAASRAQGLDYLSRFVDEAPAGHRLRGSAEEAVRFLKETKTPLAAAPLTGAIVVGSAPAEGADGGKQSKIGGVLNGKAVRLAQPPYPADSEVCPRQGSGVRVSPD